MRQSGRPPFSDSSPRAPQQVRDHLRTPGRRERPLGVLAQTVMSLRAILARRFAPPAPPPAQRDYTLSRRATPSWMADALVRPDSAPAAPPEPWTQSPFATAPAPRPARHAPPPAAPPADWAPDPALVQSPRPAPPGSRQAEAPGDGRVHGQASEPGYGAADFAGGSEAWPPEPFVPPAAPPHQAHSAEPLAERLPSAEPEPAAPPLVTVAPEPPAPRRVSTWAPDPALVPEGGWTMPIPAAGPARAVLTRARRRDAEPDAAAAPEARARPAAPERPVETGVRFTRTPDHVLQARQRRREQALREKEEARRAAEAEAAARDAAERAAAEAARAEAEAAAAAAAVPPVPLWRQPFVLPPGVRFTRTPDHLLRHPQDEPSPSQEAAPAETASVEPAQGDAPAPGAPVLPDATAGATIVTAEPAAEITATADPAIADVRLEPQAPVAAEATVATADAAVTPAPHPVAPGPIIPAHDAVRAEITPPAPVPPAQVFDVPDSAILVPVDVSHLRSLPPRPVYALDRLLQHDWTFPLPTAAEQDNRPEPVPAEEPVAEVPPITDGTAALAEPVAPTEPEASTATEVVAADVASVAEAFGPAHEAPALVPAAEPSAAILLPAPAPMLALTYAPAAAMPVDGTLPAEWDVLEAPAAEMVSAEAPLSPSATEPASAAAPLPAFVFPSVPWSFGPVPWSFIATDALTVVAAAGKPVVAPEPLPAVTGLTPVPVEDRPEEPPAAEPLPAAPLEVAGTSSQAPQTWLPAPQAISHHAPQALSEETLPLSPDRPQAAPAVPQAGRPFVYVPTGRQAGQAPAPTLPTPPRPPRIILPAAAHPVPAAAHPVPAAAHPVPFAAQPGSVSTQADLPATQPAVVGPQTIASVSPDGVFQDGVFMAAAMAAPEPLAAEPHGLVIGTAGLDVDLGLDADEDGEDEDDILAIAYEPPPRPVMPRVVEVPYELPSVDLLAEPRESDGSNLDPEMLEDNALQLQQVIQDFGVRGEILAVRPGPVVTLYEMEPAPGTKSSRVISLADDIARSMSAISARVAVVQGR
ncbi:DNA translocase FtsK, partial [Methylobacterium nonmethylotrophicum]|uniref:DNA translocase FtsK n=1 Tax=Methylobacterium nonmethylotrophicum TaxID=1141884 RepID=UPI00247A1B91